MAKMGLEALQRGDHKAKQDEGEGASPTFRANPLRIQVTDAVTGETVVDTTAQARGYKAKRDGRSGKVQAGVGWYANLSSREENRGEYKGLPVSAGLRFSLDVGKFAPTDVIDLTGENPEE